MMSSMLIIKRINEIFLLVFIYCKIEKNNVCNLPNIKTKYKNITNIQLCKVLH